MKGEKVQRGMEQLCAWQRGWVGVIEVQMQTWCVSKATFSLLFYSFE
jgi:hypothetical protein